MPRPPPAVFLLGPTASGKTAVSLALAARFPVEIVSVDSALVYRDMDIGTAKPDAATRAAFPHHLVDIVDPAEAYSAGRFRDDALRVAGGIAARGRVPLFAGGTMLYERALMRGLAHASASRRGGARGARPRGALPRLAGNACGAGARRPGERGPARPQRRAAHPARARGVPARRSFRSRRSSRAATGRSPPSPRSRWCSSPRTARCCTAGSRSASAPCSPPGSSRRSSGLRARYALDAGLPSMRAVGYRQVWETLEGKREHGDAGGARHRRHAAARQAPAHVAEGDAGGRAPGLPAPRPRGGGGGARGTVPGRVGDPRQVAADQSSPWYLKLSLSFAR